MISSNFRARSNPIAPKKEIDIASTYGRNNPGLAGGMYSGKASGSGSSHSGADDLGPKGEKWRVAAAKDIIEDLNAGKVGMC